jgi:hypothetical protein
LGGGEEKPVFGTTLLNPLFSFLFFSFHSWFPALLLSCKTILQRRHPSSSAGFTSGFGRVRKLAALDLDTAAIFVIPSTSAAVVLP